MNFKDLTLSELTAVLHSQGKAAYTAKNIFNWVYKKGAEDFAKMSNVSRELRDFLSSKYSF
ncbi:MAG: 23S rRNA (adenine(2503)-C(2))-methyltransferase RlmN, partial [Pseudomonadota bacterium]